MRELALRGVVYDSPGDDFPAMVMVFRADGGVLVAHPVGSRAEGEEMLSNVMGSVQAQVDAMLEDDAA